ncbi:ABC transporter substrate-binding protein [Ruania alba]|uniref:Multiple sugar transport system substrate-binding protein n=1 Tax=Ruania alba TaxID=648782 RepID=A0A1H5M3Z0_9MICO|nr:extracellular solute-binding protein [Ruania alba]SEE84056.1 multiple sugar transport system substrate-binding protein [Ruania alba]
MDRNARWDPSRRQALGLAGLAALSASACSRGGGAAPEADAASLRYAWWGDDLRTELTEEAIAAFEAEHPSIDVTGEFGGFDGYFDKLATQTAGGGGPDVFMMNEWNLREYADRGSLADLTGVSTDNWSDGAAGGGQVGGQLFGATAGVGLQAVLVDPAFFEDAGVEVPDDTTWTWDDFREIGRALTDGSADGSFGVTYQAGDQITANFYCAQHGAPVFDEEGVGVEVDQVRAWYDLWLQLVKEGIAPSASAALEDGSAGIEQSLFAQGQLGMLFIPTNYLTVFEDLMERELQLLRIPTRTGQPADLGMWFRPAQLYCVAATSERQEEATTLVDFLINSTQAGEILLADRGTPPNGAVREAIVDLVSGADARVFEYMDSCEPDLSTPPPPPPAGAGAYPGILGRHGEDVLFERVTPEDGAQAFVDDLTAEVA